MIKKTNKKGFTLAELLIVVAIIAVLVAIAVPLFVGSLNKAETARNDANVRSLRSYGATVIMTMESSDDFYSDLYENNQLKKAENGYQVVATLNDDGSFTITSITILSTAPGEEKVENKTVKAVIKPSDVKKSTP